MYYVLQQCLGLSFVKCTVVTKMLCGISGQPPLNCILHSRPPTLLRIPWKLRRQAVITPITPVGRGLALAIYVVHGIFIRSQAHPLARQTDVSSRLLRRNRCPKFQVVWPIGIRVLSAEVKPVPKKNRSKAAAPMITLLVRFEMSTRRNRWRRVWCWCLVIIIGLGAVVEIDASIGRSGKHLIRILLVRRLRSVRRLVQSRDDVRISYCQVIVIRSKLRHSSIRANNRHVGHRRHLILFVEEIKVCVVDFVTTNVASDVTFSRIRLILLLRDSSQGVIIRAQLLISMARHEVVFRRRVYTRHRCLLIDNTLIEGRNLHGLYCWRQQPATCFRPL
ncbi:hypothetical protein KC365_g83 [Hortaea werneckii]|nr:hypothetical protein KC365_g83 [Hortaea werneckii]